MSNKLFWLLLVAAALLITAVAFHYKPDDSYPFNPIINHSEIKGVDTI